MTHTILVADADNKVLTEKPFMEKPDASLYSSTYLYNIDLLQYKKHISSNSYHLSPSYTWPLYWENGKELTRGKDFEMVWQFSISGVNTQWIDATEEHCKKYYPNNRRLAVRPIGLNQPLSSLAIKNNEMIDQPTVGEKDDEILNRKSEQEWLLEKILKMAGFERDGKWWTNHKEKQSFSHTFLFGDSPYAPVKITDDADLWDEAARLLFERHNPGANDSIVYERILRGFSKDMNFLKQKFRIIKR